MKAGTHLLSGMLAGLTLASYLHLDQTQALLVSGAAALGSLLPDLDHPRATLRQKLGIPGDVLLFWLKHRGPTHTLAALALIAFISMQFNPLYGLALAAGYAAHLLGDMLTISGLTLMWPIYHGTLHLLPRPLRISTGGIIERFIAAILLVIFVVQGVAFSGIDIPIPFRW